MLTEFQTLELVIAFCSHLEIFTITRKVFNSLYSTELFERSGALVCEGVQYTERMQYEQLLLLQDKILFQNSGGSNSRHQNPVYRFALENNLEIITWPVNRELPFDVGVLASFGHLIPKRIIRQFPL